VNLVLSITGLLLGFGLGYGQQTADHSTGPGVKIGEAVPSFSLSDQNGKAQTLASLTGPKGLMLVFFRSADW